MALYNTFFFKFVTGNFKKNYNISTLSNPAEKQSMLKKKKKKIKINPRHNTARTPKSTAARYVRWESAVCFSAKLPVMC